LFGQTQWFGGQQLERTTNATNHQVLGLNPNLGKGQWVCPNFNTKNTPKKKTKYSKKIKNWLPFCSTFNTHFGTQIFGQILGK
jgi:hypothetical protein